MDLLTLVYAVFGIGFLIFVHELGHFLAAKRVGIRVETFALGFQPTIFGFKARFCAFKYGDTEYVVGMLPFGGYVKMAGEEHTDERTGADDEYASKKPNERAQVLVAGAVMNLIFGFIFFIIAYSVGVPTPSSKIGAVEPGSAAWEAGIRPGDEVTALNGTPVREYPELFTKVALSSRENALDLTLDRSGEPVEVSVTPRFDAAKGMLTIGIDRAWTSTVDLVAEDSAAAASGLEPGDDIRSITFESDTFSYTVPSSIPTTRLFPLIQRFTGLHPGGRLSLEVQGENGTPRTVQIQAKLDKDLTKSSRPRVGVLLRQRVITHVQPNSAADAVLEPGVEIVEVGGEPVGVFDIWTVAAAKPGPLTLGTAEGASYDIDRDELFRWFAESTIDVRPTPIALVEGDSEEPKSPPAIVGRVLAGGPAALAGILAGDRIAEVDGAAIGDFEEFSEAVRDHDGEEPLLIAVERSGERMEFSVTPNRDVKRFGFQLARDTFEKRGGIVEACQLGFSDTILWMKRVFLTLKALVKRDVSASNLSGPVGIVMATKTVSTEGLGKFLWFLALISVNLGVFNLLPFPILDGGHLTFLLVEKIKGSPVSDSVLHYSHLVAFLLLISLALFVTYHDIVRWILPR